MTLFDSVLGRVSNPWFVLAIAKYLAREGNLVAAGAWIHELVFMQE
jgi:hypothetical protein